MRTFRRFAAAVVLSGLFLATLSRAQDQAPNKLSPADEAGVISTVQAFGDTLTAMDFDTFATLIAEDADWVNFVGMHWHGREQILKGHRAVFTTRYRHVPWHMVDKTEAQLAPGVARVVSTVKFDDYTAQDGKRMTDNLFRLTWVLEKHDGKWLVRAGQNTIIDLQAAPHDPGK